MDEFNFKLLAAGVVGASAGILLTISVQGTLAQILLTIAATAAPSVVATHFVKEEQLQNIRQKFLNQLDMKQEEIKGKERELVELRKLPHELAGLHKTFELYKLEAAKELETSQQKNGELLTAKREALEKLKELSELVEEREVSLRDRNEQLEALQEEIVSLKGDREDYAQKVAQSAFQTLYKEKIEPKLTQRAQLMGDTLDKYQELLRWGENVNARLVGKNALINQISNQFNEGIDNAAKVLEEREQGYLKQIDSYIEQIARLQRQINGELTEPVYSEKTFRIPSEIANRIIYWVWNAYKIPLKYEGVAGDADGLMIGGFSYSTRYPIAKFVGFLKSQSREIAEGVGIHKIVNIEKFSVAPVLLIRYRREPELKEDEIQALIGTPKDFLKYVTSHPIRYRIIGDPGSGKTPLTEVLVSSLIKSGCHIANLPNKPTTEHLLVTVSYPGGLTSRKDTNYQLSPFLEYATEEEAHKSFNEAVEDYNFRTKNPSYCDKFFHLYVWDELDNTLDSHSDSKKAAELLRKLLKQGGHYSMGVIASGQSVMTKQLPGFTNDDRTLFTEIVIGINKIRKYLDSYGKTKGSGDRLKQFIANLDLIQDWLEKKRKRVTDTAKTPRVALIADEYSPKLYLLPNFDISDFDYQTVSNSRKSALEFKQKFTGYAVQGRKEVNPEALANQAIQPIQSSSPDSTIEGVLDSVQNQAKPHCPNCNSGKVKPKGKDRFYCLNDECKAKTFTRTKAIWR